MTFLALSTSVHRYADSGLRTGMWLGEYTHFYDVLEKAGHSVELASVKGGLVPLDPVSLLPPVLMMGGTNKRYESPDFMDSLEDTRSIADIDYADFDGIFLVGGHGAMFDFQNAEVKKAVSCFADAGKIVSAVCHGPCGLLDVPVADGGSVLAGKKATGYSWVEEKMAKRTDEVPFSLEEKMRREVGDTGEYSTARVPMTKNVVRDGNLITGQNPTSAAGVGEAVVELLGR